MNHYKFVTKFKSFVSLALWKTVTKPEFFVSFVRRNGGSTQKVCFDSGYAQSLSNQ